MLPCARRGRAARCGKGVDDEVVVGEGIQLLFSRSMTDGRDGRDLGDMPAPETRIGQDGPCAKNALSESNECSPASARSMLS